MHSWSETGAARMNDTINFLKNVALLGAALMFAAIPRPWAASVDAGAKRTHEPVPMAPRTAARG